MPKHLKDSDIQTRMKLEMRGIGIPPRPTILRQIEEEMARGEPDFLRLARLIGSDVGLGAGLIKTANSPFFMFGHQVRTIQESLLVLGLNVVMQTLAGLSLQEVFKRAPNMERFWDASAATARLSGALAARLGAPYDVRPEDAYTFALFRDCGIPVLMMPFPEYRAVLAKANDDVESDFTDIEDGSIGLNHAVVGAELAEDWRLPADICTAIRYHHDRAAIDGSGEQVLAERPRALIAIAQLAEHMLQNQTGLAKTSEWVKFGPACLLALEIDTADLPDLEGETAATVAAAGD